MSMLLVKVEGFPELMQLTEYLGDYGKHAFDLMKKAAADVNGPLIWAMMDGEHPQYFTTHADMIFDEPLATVSVEEFLAYGKKHFYMHNRNLSPEYQGL